MQLIVFLSLLLGSALAAETGHYTNVTVHDILGDLRYGPIQPLPQLSLNYLNLRPFIFFVHPYGGKPSAAFVQGLQGLGRFPEYVEYLNQGNKVMVVGYPGQMPRNVSDRIPAIEVVNSAGHGQVGITQLPQLAAEFSYLPIVLVQGRTKNQLVRQEQLNEIGTVQVTPEGKVKIIRDVVTERLQDPKYGAFFNPYGFTFQGYNNAYPFNYGYPYYGFQSQYSGYGSYPNFAFQGHYPYYGFQGHYPSSTFQAQYPFYGFQGQYPSHGHQGQYYNYGPAVKQSPAFPGYSHYMGYNGLFPGYGGAYFYPATFGTPAYPFGYNYVPTPYYPGVNPFFFHGQRTPQEDTTKAGYQYGSYPPFTFYAQQPQHQYGYQYQGYPFSYYQSYPFYQPGAKSYQYTPYQEYQYQPYHFQQYQPYYFSQYQPFQYQYYQNYQPYGQYYPQ